MGRGKSRDTISYSPRLTGKRIILGAFAASVIIHGGILIGSPNIFSVREFGAKLRAFKVDLIRPPMEEIHQQSKEPHPQISQTLTESARGNEEATISLDTKDAAYYPYAKIIKKRIQRHWTYPSTARENYLQGNLLIIFRLEKNGDLVSCRISRSSGYQILDSASIKAIELASPFPPFPDTIPVQFLNINTSFTYQLKFED
jgi:TonB family protein